MTEFPTLAPAVQAILRSAASQVLAFDPDLARDLADLAADYRRPLHRSRGREMSARCLNCGRPGWIGLCVLCSPASESATAGCTGSIDGECCDRPAHTDCATAGPYTEETE